MLRLAKKGVWAFAQRMGYELVPSSVYNNEHLRARGFFEHLGIDMIIDVGANVGQFALRCRQSGYDGDIVSFEPLREAHAVLSQRAATDPKWTVAERMAVGDHNGTVEINVANNSESSSVLPMLGSHTEALPESKYIEKQVVPIRRLDDVIGAGKEGRGILLKLDVQGLEPEVLSGATELLPQVTALKLEMSLIPLYEGETLFLKMCSTLEQQGFQLWDLEPGFRHGQTGRLLQVDGIFVNTRKTPAARA